MKIMFAKIKSGTRGWNDERADCEYFVKLYSVGVSTRY